MKRLIQLSLVVGALCWPLASDAIAQRSGGISPFPVSPPASNTNRNGVDISVSYQFRLDGSAASLEEQAELSEQGRRALYSLLGRECGALLDTIAATCEVRRANVSSQINQARMSRRGIRVSGSATYRITLKPRARGDDKTD